MKSTSFLKAKKYNLLCFAHRISSHLFAPFLFLVFLLLHAESYCQAPPYPLGTAPACMKTYSLAINTGMNWISGGWEYGTNQADGYWTAIRRDNANPPNVSNIHCATVWDMWLPGGWNQYPQTRAISFVNSGTPCANNMGAPPVCNLNDDKYIFRRSFWLDGPAQTANIAMTVICDNYLEAVILNGTVLSGESCVLPPWPGDPNTLTYTVVLNPGWNYLDFDVRNYHASGSSTMALKVNGTITASNPDLVKNEYYRPNNTTDNPSFGCIAPSLYIQVPDILGTCIPIGMTSATMTITNFDPAFTYSVTPAAGLNGNTFTGVLGTTYTVTVTDAYNCSLSTSVLITQTANPPVITLPVNHGCINYPVGYFIYSGTMSAGVPAYSAVINPNANATVSTNGNNFGGAVGNAGIYTVIVADALNCQASTTLFVGNIFPLTLSGPSNGPPCLTPGGTTQIIATVPGWVQMGTYQLDGGAPQPGNQFTVNAPGIYTVTAMDIYGCTSVSTIQVNNYPVITSVTSNNVPCNEVLTATATNGAGLQWFFGNNNPNPNPYTITAYTSPVQACQTFTVVATDAIGCTASSNYTWCQDPFCCGMNAVYQGGDHFSSYPIYNNGTATAISTFYGGNTITTPNKILFSGTITINQNITFLNCPDIVLDENARILVLPGVTLTIDGCNLKAHCDEMWDGIYGNTAATQIIIKNSTLRDMINGVNLISGAKIESRNTNYYNNYTSMKIINAPNPYNVANGNCIILNNTFAHVGNVNLLSPYSFQIKGERGILVQNTPNTIYSKEVQIGELGTATSSNTFDNLYCGIQITGGNMTVPESYRIYNNKFKNINQGWANTPNYDYFKIYGWANNTHLGAAIYSRPASGTAAATHKLDVIAEYIDDIHFYRCDKCVYTQNTSVDIRNNNAKECVMGFMHSRADGQKHTINNNILGDVMKGIYFGGNIGKSKVWENWITCRGTNAQQGPFWPEGIAVNFATQNTTSDIELNANIIRLYNRAGIGIGLRLTNQLTKAVKNNIQVQWGAWGNVDSSQYVSSCIYTEKANKSVIQGNILHGANIDMITNVNKWTGLWMSNSQNCFVECNHQSYLRKGFYTVSNCATLSDRVKGNTFYAHGRGMTFHDLGTQGTFGNIGSTSNDNNNVFANAALFGNGYGIYRNGTTPHFGVIFTTNFGIGYSGAPVAVARYGVNNFASNPYSCPTNLAFTEVQNLVNEGYSVEEALAIVHDGREYVDYEEVAKWMEKQELLAQLAGDSAMTTSDTALQNFYNQQMQSNNGTLNTLETLFSQLADSTLASDSTQYYQLLFTIDSINSSISSSNTLEQNMVTVNRYRLKWICGGIDSLSANEKDTLATLAKMCPFIGGTAVYRARSIYSEIEPTDMNDVVICNAAGVYKNGSGAEDEDETIDPSLLAALGDSHFKIYPNPASTQVTVDYSLNLEEQGELIFYDLLGREYMRTGLSATVNHVTLSTTHLPKGVYLCKYAVNGLTRSTKKLVIE